MRISDWSSDVCSSDLGELRGLVLSAHTAREQNRWLFIIGGVGILLGLLLYAAFAGPVAHLAPASWQWPESVAARVLDEPTPWDAGTHLMQRASPASGGMCVAGHPLPAGNREALQACRAAATWTTTPVSCPTQHTPQPSRIIP